MKLNVYVPDKLGLAIRKAKHLNVSMICQKALIKRLNLKQSICPKCKQKIDK